MVRKYIVVSDLDGTLANIKHRVRFISHPSVNCPVCLGKNPKECDNCKSLGWSEFKKDYKTFEAPENVKRDTLLIMNNAVVQATARFLNAEIWICTGRSDKLRSLTVSWLRDNHVNYNKLLMRPVNNRIPDDELKAGWVEGGVIPLDQVACVFEDRTRVVEMYRDKYQLQVYQVANGDF